MPADTGTNRPTDPSRMTREALVKEVRRWRADSAVACHLTDVSNLDEDSARRRLAILENALAFMPVGFGLYDADDRLVFKNNRFQLFDDRGERDRPGTCFEDILRFGVETGTYPDALDDPEAWVAERLAQHAHPGDRIMQRTNDGRHILIEERRLDDGCTIATYTDVSQIKQAEETVDRALQDATRASNSKSVFLANMSHELRTPLNAIIGFAQVLLSPGLTVTSETKRQEYLQDILDAARHLLAIISDILDVSRVEVGGYKVVKQPVDVLEICRAVYRMFEIEAAKAEVSLSISADDPASMVWHADPRALQQMVINLVANSLRYTASQGRIDIAIRQTGDALCIDVADNGSGIPADELREVVKPFHRGKESPRHSPGGLGLGLALTSMLMDLHGGELRLASELNAGTTATLWFPRSSTSDADTSGTHRAPP